MLLSGRQSLISRGLKAAEQLHAAMLVFQGFPPVAASRWLEPQTAEGRDGGFVGSVPGSYFIRRENIPAGLQFVAKETTFTDGAKRVRVLEIDDKPNEPHVRLSTELASR